MIDSYVISPILAYGFDIIPANSSNALCKLVFYAAYFFSTYYTILLILASIDRLLISSQNIDTRLYSSKRLAYFSMSIGAFVWATFSLHVAIKAGVQQFSPTYSICYYDPSAGYIMFNSYAVLVLTAVQFSILILLSIFSFKNIRHIRITLRKEHHEVRSMSKKDFQLLRCLYAHDISYIIFSVLSVVGVCFDTVLMYHSPNEFQEAIQLFLSDLSALLHFIPFCTSFFIFIIISRSFRQKSKRIVLKILGKNVRPIRHEAPNRLGIARNNMEMNNVVAIAINTIALAS